MMSREERIALNMRQICLHEAKPNIKPMSSTTVTRGFEKVAFPKIVSVEGNGIRTVYT